MRTKAAKIVDDLLATYPDGACDFVENVAAPLPLQIICEMMGIPEADEKQVFAWTNVILGVGDPEYASTFEELHRREHGDEPVRAGPGGRPPGQSP